MTHLYLCCLDTDAIESRGIAPLKKIVDKVSSLFPLSAPNYFTDMFDCINAPIDALLTDRKTNAIAETLSYVVSIGLSALLSVHVIIDRRNPGKRMIEFRELDFGLAIDDYFLLSGAGMSRLQKYEDTITHAFTVFGYGNDATAHGLRADHEVVGTRPISGLMPEQSWNPVSLRQFECCRQRICSIQRVLEVFGSTMRNLRLMNSTVKKSRTKLTIL